MSYIYGTSIYYSTEVLIKKNKVAYNRGRKIFNIKEYECSSSKLYLLEDGYAPVIMDGCIINKNDLINKYFLKEETILSDKDLLFRLYKVIGIELLSQINGDFSFVIYDEEQQILFGARDRLGVKPFYYVSDKRGFEFSSQLLPLCIGNNYNINELSRQFYFTFQYVPDPYSIIKEVNKLRAGEYFIYSLADKSLEIKKYWDIYDNTSNFEEPKSIEEAIEISEALINTSLKERVEQFSTTSVGTFLSGGIDSSLMTMLLSQQVQNLSSFSIGFENVGFDESEYARAVANELKIDLHQFTCTPKDALDVIEKIPMFYDEPMGDASSIPSTFLSQKSKQFIDFAVGGDGGDEIFWGYSRYLRYFDKKKIYHIPYSLRMMLAYCLQQYKPRLSESLKFNDVQTLYNNRRNYNIAERFNPFEIEKNHPDLQYLYKNKDVRKAFSDFDIKSLMNYAYITKMDRPTSGNALNFTAPLLDYRLVEYSRILPIDLMYKEGVGQKLILRNILYKKLPKELFERKKRGFGVPLVHWFRNDLKDYVQDVLNKDTLLNIPEYDIKSALQLINNHIVGKENHTTFIWLCINYLLWLDYYNKVINM